MTGAEKGQHNTSRIFVGGLNESITEQDLEEKLARFGEIVSVKMKTKDHESSDPNTFAFVEMKASPSRVTKCLTTFSNTHWKGCTLKLQLAKESFLDRLQKERESRRNDYETPSVNGIGSCNLEPIGHRRPKHDSFEETHVRSRRKPYADDEVANQTDFRDVTNGDVVEEIEPPSKSVFLERLENFSVGVWKDDATFEVVAEDYTPKPAKAVQDCEDDEDDEVDANNLIRSKTLPSERTASSRPTIVKPLSASGLSSEKHALSDKRRLQTLDEKLTVMKLQQSLVKAALLNVDSTARKKIVFGSDDEDVEVGHVAISKKKEQPQRDRSASKLKLFENDDDFEDEDDHDASFAFKPQFQGEPGQKLIQLQNRYGNDSRFKIDQRFVEDGAEPIPEEIPDGSLENEKFRNFTVLESVLGYQLQVPEEDDVKKKFKSKHWTEMIPERYDPAREGHEKYEIQRDATAGSTLPTISAKSAKRLRKEQEEQRKLVLPEVSNKRFFEVEQNLADAFKSKQDSGTFSLSKLFDHPHGSARDDFTFESEPMAAPRTYWDSNPFTYDSSSDDEDESGLRRRSGRQSDRAGRKEEIGDRQESDELKSATASRRQTFFLFKNDPRLKEGAESFRRHEDMQMVEQKWRSTRAELLSRVRMKRKRLMVKLAQNQKRETQADNNRSDLTRKHLHPKSYNRRGIGKKRSRVGRHRSS